MTRPEIPTPLPCLLALALAACTSLDREPSKPIEQSVTVDSKKPDKPPEKPTPDKIDTSATAVRVAVASVQLDDDCPDPAPPSEVPPASPTRTTPPATESAPMPPRPGDPPSAVSYRRACVQSTVQLKLTNDGKAEASVRIARITLHDVQSKGALASVTARLPSAFTDGSTYTPWNERLAAGAEFNASYRLKPPDWWAVEANLGGASSRGREFELEITVEIDGKPMTVRSPAFSRPPEIIMPPT